MTSPSGDYREQTARVLDRIATRGEEHIRQMRSREAFVRAWPRALPFVLAAPGILFVLALPRLWGSEGLVLAPWLAVLITLALPILLIAVPALIAENRRPGRRESLAFFDRHEKLRDRLLAADEFLASPPVNSFAEATIAEALPHAERALEAEPTLEPAPFPGSSRDLRFLIPAGILLVLPHLWGSSTEIPEPAPLSPAVTSVETPRPTAEREVALATLGNSSRVEAERARPDSPRPPPGEELPVQPEPRARPSGDSDQDVLENEGKTRGGQPAFAPSTGRSQKSRGVPGSQAPSTSPHDESLEPKKPKPRKKASEKETDEPPRKKTEDRSGATAGRGSSSGSSRNPAASQWSSKDRVAESEEQELEEEDDVDDEDTESEARGGLQPNLRDRRPPTNRDLSIGFGNRSNPDANGRGGPGQRKKSRGVASLVLGVPVPDHVKGQPNPGRVKITQERVRPRQEAAEPEEAGARTPRESPPELLGRRTLLPWMREVLRRYFERETAGVSESEKLP